ncbi:MAG: AAA-type ATPase family expressed [Trebouxia sp. A1-2]|nr:MAG: AAA-type ATPase family expressed [Trebouxia sp. A1-2]
MEEPNSERRAQSSTVKFDELLQKLLAVVCFWILQKLASLQDVLLSFAVFRKAAAYGLAPRCQHTVLHAVQSPDKISSSFEQLEYYISEDAQELLMHAALHGLVASSTPQLSHSSIQLPNLGRILLQTATKNSALYQESVAAALAKRLKADFLVIDDVLLSSVAKAAFGSSIDKAEQQEDLGKLLNFILSIWLAAKHVEEGGSAAPPPPSGSTPAGHDDGLGPILPDFGSLLHADKPDARRLLSKLFPTRVKLAPPPEGAAAAKHNTRIAKDADKILARNNYRVLKTLSSAVGVVPPEAASSVYSKRQLSLKDWTKVLAWARSMEAISRTATVIQSQNHVAGETGADVDTAGSASQLVAPAQKQIRRSQSAAGSASTPLESLPLLQQQPTPQQQTHHQKHQEQAQQARAQTESKLHSKGKKDGAADGATPAENLEAHADEAAGVSLSAEKQGLQLSEGAIWYGLHMLERSGGPMRQHIMTENVYEQRLLPEVVNSDEAGAGFAEVGALSEAKDALREAVQLPLQHPHLFQKGSLARPCRGVLLFGPPGTGKTLLARAAAAECGASFLAIHPSTVASKWLGDGVRYMRAVFSLASKLSPCVLFIDEVDAMLSKRDSQREHEAHREIKNEFMAQWDGIRTGSSSSVDRVMVLGATNRPQDLDEAVLRRFSRRIFCDLPNRQARKQILDVILSGEATAEDVSTTKIADNTEGFSGSDLRQLCTAAAMCGIRELMKATSKAAQDKAAAKKAQHAARSPPSADRQDGPQFSQLPDQQGGAAKLSRSAADQSGSSHAKGVPATTAAAGLAAEGQGQSKPSKGNKRDNEEGAGSTTTKRLKSSADSVTECTTENGLHASTADSTADRASTGTQTATDSNQKQSSDGIPSSSTLEPLTASGQAQASSLDPEARKAETSEQGSPGMSGGQVVKHTEQQQQCQPEASGRRSVDWLLAKYKDVAAAADQQAKQELRPITSADFDAARQQVTPSTNPDSMVISELKQWNATYGESGNKAYRQHLSYFT